MGLNQSQGQLGHFVDQMFEAAMFLYPLLDLRDEVNRDVGGVGFGFDLPGQIVPQMFVASGAAAVGIAAGSAEGDEAGGQDWTLGLKLLLTGQEEATDQGGMLWNLHGEGESMLMFVH
jgi:hypothetical protein